MQNVSELLAYLALEPIRENVFIGKNHDIGVNRVFGGQVLSQALDAAMLTVPEERKLHSMHAYFILPGNLEEPITFKVDIIRNGKSFTTRRITAIQHDKAIFSMSSSFQLNQKGFTHQIAMPNILPPESLISDTTSIKDIPKNIRTSIKERPIDFRTVERISNLQNYPPIRHIWIRIKGKLPDDLRIHQRILAYASDCNLLTTAILPHHKKVSLEEMQIASLDHAIWFHRDFRMDDWLLYTLDSPSASNSRGFTKGNIFSKDGILVASVVQEGLLRKLKK